MRHVTKRKLSVVAGLVMAVAATIAAVAYWTGTGTGTGTADVGTTGSVVVTGTVAPGISPGTSAVVTFTAANPTASPVQVTTLHLDSVTADAGHAACDTADFTMSDVIEDQLVPANATAEALLTNGSLVYANTAVDQNACKGATLTLGLSSIA